VPVKFWQRPYEESNHLIARPLAAVENFTEEINHADPRVRKRVIQTLFEEIKTHPKEGNPWSRIVELSRAYIPLVGFKMASPTGPVSLRLI
jgi:hypothetical protein